MGISKKYVNADGSIQNEQEDSDTSDSDSDESMSGTDEEISDEDRHNITQETTTQEVDENSDNNEGNGGEEEEDAVIKAIREASAKKRDHPPVIECDSFVVDICFHPGEDLLAVANIDGDVLLYKYTNEENTLLQTIELHEKACRSIDFSDDGNTLFSASKDKAIMLTDVETCKLKRFYENSHDVPVYTISVLNENLFGTGDDGGTIKLWDLRVNGDQSIFSLKKNEDYISNILTHSNEKYLFCSSGDGSLTTIDLKNRKFFMQSEEYEEELTSLGLFRDETKLLASSSKGNLFLYNWNEFGLHSDMFPGPKTAVNAIVPITENIVVTACEDGVLRAAHLFPHRYLGIVGR
ncbi:WD40 domain-containing protein, partial [Oryctes borbonicus]